MKYKLFGQKLYVGNVLIYEGDDLQDVKKHYDDVLNDSDYVSADIIDTTNWTVVSYIDLSILPKRNDHVKKIGSKENNKKR